MAFSPKTIGIALATLVLLFFLGTAFMFFTNTCPPKGPWPQPPWCAGSPFPSLPAAQPPAAMPSQQAPSSPGQAAPSETGQAAPSGQGQTVPSQPPALPSFFQQDTSTQLDFAPSLPSYISAPVSSKKLTLGMGMMDFWGQVCLNNMCEDPTKEIAPSMKRVSQTGAKFVLFTDYVSLGNDLSISTIPFSGAHTASQQELSSVVSEAKMNGMKSMLITNLYGDGRNAIGSKPTSEQLKTLLSGWNATLSRQALRAQEAGFDYMIINPRDIHFMFDDPRGNEANLGLAAMIPSVRESYKGKVCVWGTPWALQTPELISQVDCIVSDQAIEWLLKGRNETPESLQAGWKSYLSDAAFNSFSGKEHFVLVLMPSYKGVLSKGWIEPVADYTGKPLPEKDWKTQALVYDALFRELNANDYRVDGVISYGYWWNDNMYPQSIGINSLSQSIRGKDAEQVFYAWSKISG